MNLFSSGRMPRHHVAMILLLLGAGRAASASDRKAASGDACALAAQPRSVTGDETIPPLAESLS
jgi:hypothetical protein